MRLRIILADDHQLFRAAPRPSLERILNAEIVEADNGLQVLELMRRAPADLILMDIGMPVMNGIEATRRVTDLYPAVKVIGVSALSDHDFVLDTFHAGASAYVTKHVPHDELLRAIDVVRAGGTYISPDIRHIAASLKKKISESGPIQPVPKQLRIELISVSETLSQQMRLDPALIHQLAPDQFEELICERLFAMGFEPRRVGNINRKDGGVDVVFWPREYVAFPFLGAAQVKHHRNPMTKEGPRSVRDFTGAMSAHPFNAGLLVTNTGFTPDATWFAQKNAALLRLRGFRDIQRWLGDNFTDEEEWKEIPSSIELCPGVVIKIR